MAAIRIRCNGKLHWQVSTPSPVNVLEVLEGPRARRHRLQQAAKPEGLQSKTAELEALEVASNQIPPESPVARENSSHGSSAEGWISG